MKAWVWVVLFLVLAGGGAAFYFFYWKKRKSTAPSLAKQMAPTYTPQQQHTLTSSMPVGKPVTKAIPGASFVDSLSKTAQNVATQAANKLAQAAAERAAAVASEAMSGLFK
jgi:hypothetical protein